MGASIFVLQFRGLLQSILEQHPKIMRNVQRSRNGRAALPALTGVSLPASSALPCGTKVQNYGYYTEVNGVKWLYIQVTYQGVKYTGFSSGAYLKKV